MVDVKNNSLKNNIVVTVAAVAASIGCIVVDRNLRFVLASMTSVLRSGNISSGNHMIIRQL